jgi:dGTP triphosphohydrolase
MSIIDRIFFWRNRALADQNYKGIPINPTREGIIELSESPAYYSTAGDKKTAIVKTENKLPLYAVPSKEYDDTDPQEKRSEFIHDEHEIVFSPSFRSLSDKSQVVVKPSHKGHARSRLTHTLEVAEIAKGLGTLLELNVELISAIAMGHDIGHAPFGHAGEGACQEIMKDIIKYLCDQKRIKTKLIEYFKKTFDMAFDNASILDEKGEIQNHLLFHHANNSCRVIDRKLRNITQLTKKGILTHSWSPWRPASKFGIPNTYEGQVAAIADQIAGITQDTEDILCCVEAGPTFDNIVNACEKHFIGNKAINMSTACLNGYLLKWFDHTTNSVNKKWLIGNVINEIVRESKDKCNEFKGGDLHLYAQRNPLKLTNDMMQFLRGYEDFVRKGIVQCDTWFKARDALAVSVVHTAFDFYKNRPTSKKDERRLGEDETKIENEFYKYKEHQDQWSSEVNSEYDLFYKLITECAADESKKSELDNSIRVVDYVAGLTDDHITEIHRLAFTRFL